VQTLFTWLLMLVLGGSVLSLLAMGLGQVRRANRLARQAHHRRMSFAGADPFDIPVRYRNLALVCSGHSAHAHNITHGRLAGWPVRACDLRFECGHGTRRLTRHYSVVLAETDIDLPPLLMWHEHDQDNTPMAVRRSERQQGPWSCLGDERLGQLLTSPWAGDPPRPVSLQILGHVLMLCCPVTRRKDDYQPLLDMLAGTLARLNDAPARQAVATGGVSQ